MNIMELDGYKATISFDTEKDRFRGEILGLNGGADFYGRTPEELRIEFRKSLKFFLKVCDKRGIQPRKAYSGRFNVRIPPELHAEVVAAADASGVSLNQFVERSLRESAKH